MARILSIFSGLALLTVLAYSGGLVTAYKEWLPWQKLLEARQMWRSFRFTGNPFLPESVYRALDSYPDDRHTLHRADLAAPGLLLINRIDPETGRYVSDLLDADGNVLHSWPVDYSRIVPGGNPGEFVHVARPLPDGSLLVNFDDANALARLDSCGDPIWSRTEQVYHHSIRPDPDQGGYWTWEANLWDGGHDQRMVRFDEETGEILESIDLVSDVMAVSPRNQMIFGLPEGFEVNRAIRPGTAEDIMHPNDVKPLPAAWADAFPQFDAGDLLISLRILNMVAVIDRQTHDVLWYQQGPWIRQHDPDWHPDGTITVYSNNTYRLRSSIIRMDPVSREFGDEFRATELNFDSFIMGQHDRLANGNWLITSPTEGRVIEVTADGRLVREYVNYANDDYVMMVTFAQLLPPGFFSAMPSCGG